MLFLTCAQRKKEKYVSIFYLLVPSLENVGIFSSTNMGNPFLINMYMWLVLSYCITAAAAANGARVSLRICSVGALGKIELCLNNGPRARARAFSGLFKKLLSWLIWFALSLHLSFLILLARHKIKIFIYCLVIFAESHPGSVGSSSGCRHSGRHGCRLDGLDEIGAAAAAAAAAAAETLYRRAGYLQRGRGATDYRPANRTQHGARSPPPSLETKTQTTGWTTSS
jgi:hypothetical protein